nr:S-layer homology domain-containing protein [Paenibacillus harenae]
MPKEGAALSFQDVAHGIWYYEYVNAASRWGLVQGAQGRFRPNDPVTREEMALMVMRALKLLGKDDVDESQERLKPYKDEDEISIWARNALSSAVEAKLIEEVDKEHLHPKATATRAQAAVVIYRLLAYADWL